MRVRLVCACVVCVHACVCLSIYLAVCLLPAELPRPLAAQGGSRLQPVRILRVRRLHCRLPVEDAGVLDGDQLSDDRSLGHSEKKSDRAIRTGAAQRSGEARN